MFLELTPDLVTLLTGMQTTINDIQAEVVALRAEVCAKPSSPIEPRQWYSIKETADLLGKGVYSVREWARLGRINAAKREERRGGAALWRISAEEVARYKEEGLLPIDPDRNNHN